MEREREAEWNIKRAERKGKGKSKGTPIGDGRHRDGWCRLKRQKTPFPSACLIFERGKEERETGKGQSRQ